MMDEALFKKVRAAAVAGWWTLLVAIGFGLIQAGGIWMLLHFRPSWVPKMWGGTSWETIQTVVVWMVAVYKLLVWAMFLVVVWLTIWSARLKRAD